MPHFQLMLQVAGRVALKGFGSLEAFETAREAKTGGKTGKTMTEWHKKNIWKTWPSFLGLALEKDNSQRDNRNHNWPNNMEVSVVLYICALLRYSCGCLAWIYCGWEMSCHFPYVIKAGELSKADICQPNRFNRLLLSTFQYLLPSVHFVPFTKRAQWTPPAIQNLDIKCYKIYRSSVRRCLVTCSLQAFLCLIELNVPYLRPRGGDRKPKVTWMWK